VDSQDAAASGSGDRVAVGRIGRAHGVRGEVAVEVRTDAPEQRFAVGAVLRTDPASVGPLTVEAARSHHGRLLVHFAGVQDRAAASAMAGTFLLVDPATAADAGRDAYWDHELVGMSVVDVDGATVGTVGDVVHSSVQDLLVVVRDDTGTEVLVPFVAALVPDVDVPNRRIVIDPPPGLLDL